MSSCSCERWLGERRRLLRHVRYNLCRRLLWRAESIIRPRAAFLRCLSPSLPLGAHTDRPCYRCDRPPSLAFPNGQRDRPVHGRALLVGCSKEYGSGRKSRKNELARNARSVYARFVLKYKREKRKSQIISSSRRTPRDPVRSSPRRITSAGCRIQEVIQECGWSEKPKITLLSKPLERREWLVVALQATNTSPFFY